MYREKSTKFKGQIVFVPTLIRIGLHENEYVDLNLGMTYFNINDFVHKNTNYVGRYANFDFHAAIFNNHNRTPRTSRRPRKKRKSTTYTLPAYLDQS